MTTGRINQITRYGAPCIPRNGVWQRPAAPERAEREIRKGRTKRPAAAAPPAYRGRRERPSNCPHKAPQRQSARRCSNRVALSGGGWLRHMALGWRVRTPWTTPTNGGSHGAAPSRNLSFRCGQRPSIHRPQRCRGPNGPRTSGATAASHVYLRCIPRHVNRLRRHGRAPKGHSELHM